jgi:hypothetical protein
VVRLTDPEPQGVPAIDEQRRVTFPQVHIARVQLREVGDDLGGRVALPGDQALHLRDELGVGEATQGSENIVLHICLYHDDHQQWVRIALINMPRMRRESLTTQEVHVTRH